MKRRLIVLLFISLLLLVGCSKEIAIEQDEDDYEIFPEICSFSAGLACVDFSVTNDKIVLTIINGMGRDLENFKITKEECRIPAEINKLEDGATETFEITECSNLQIEKGKVGGVVNYTYSINGISHEKTALVISRV